MDTDVLTATGPVPAASDPPAIADVPDVPHPVLLAGFRLMLQSRLLDERAYNLQRQGRLGTFAPAQGQEAVIAGTALAIERGRDWLVPQYRENAALLHHGYPLESLLLYFIGNPAGALVPDGVNILPIQIALAAQLPHAVGLAWGMRLQRREGVVLTYCGDGASSEGDFHEAMNLAGVMKAPVVVVLVNNGYAISTPRAKQTAAESFASRAVGYGIAGETVDGNDFVAVHQATARAVARARRGGGATLIEAVTYRLWAHNTADDHTRYVAPEELEARRLEDPVPRMRAYLTSLGLLDEPAELAMREEIAAEIAAAVTAAEAHPHPHVGQVFDHVYAGSWPRLEQQRAELTAAFEGES